MRAHERLSDGRSGVVAAMRRFLEAARDALVAKPEDVRDVTGDQRCGQVAERRIWVGGPASIEVVARRTSRKRLRVVPTVEAFIDAIADAR